MTAHAPRWWWLSFVDRACATDPSSGPGSPAHGDVAMHLGVAIVMATSLDDAVQEAWTRKINPGGEVAGMPLIEPVGASAPHGWPFTDPPSRQRFTYRLLQGGDIGEAQVFLDGVVASAPGGYATFRGICWDDDACTHGNSHGLARSVMYGRCRSGRRWFWFAAHCDSRRGGDGEVQRHCDHPVCIYGGAHEFGWEDTSDTATVAARVAVERLAAGCAVVSRYHGAAADALRRINAARRKMRGQQPVTGDPGCLYGIRYRSSDDWSRPDPGPEILSFPIARKTPKRVYYVRSTWGWHTFHTGEPDLGYVDRSALERDGHVSTRRQGGIQGILYATREAAEGALTPYE